MDELLKIAIPELGQKEILGPEDNPTIVNYANKAGFTWVNDDETPWCSIFLNWCTKKAGLKGSGKANARSWLNVGKTTSNPKPGDIVVFWRESLDSWKGHVSIFFGFNKERDKVFCLGGNQGNMVSIMAYPSYQVLDFRKIETSELIQPPDKVLKIGDKGQDVNALQEALQIAGFNPGQIDGNFGINTQTAVMALQAISSHLTIDGIYGKKTRKYLFNLLSQ